MEPKRIDIYDPYDIYADLDKERLRSGDLREVKKDAKSRSQETRGSDPLPNQEAPGREVHSLSDSPEGGSPRRPHGSGSGAKKEKLQRNGKKRKKRGLLAWILGGDGKYHRRSKRTKPKAEARR